MKNFDLPFWKEAPFIRILAPFIIGIALSFYLEFPQKWCIGILITSLITLLAFSAIQLKWQFRFRQLNGVLLNFILCAFGGWLANLKNPFQVLNTVEQFKTASTVYIVKLKEDPAERKSSWKALSSLRLLKNTNEDLSPETDIILYFKKDSSLLLPSFGKMIAFKKSPERIKNFLPNSAFDYQKYCSLKNIHYQVFLQPSEFICYRGKYAGIVSEFLNETKKWVVGILQKNINGMKECGLAEALLIGYKNDLDKTLIQSYSNTGVVHVVAISGLHLGLIYSILHLICIPLKGSSTGKVLRPAILISGLWIFSLLAGGSPSVLRSACMFSTIVVGESVSKRSSLLNNLAASAFFLLCYDPFWLWDLGFILSYMALLGMVLFMKPIYHFFVIENKIVDAAWKVNAVTIAAQVLTMPVLIYYFGQFPTLFIITNFLVIPLSGIILAGEIILCSISFLEPVALLTGRLLAMLISFMNDIVEYVDSLSFSSIKYININFLQVALLYVFITFVAGWLIGKHKQGLPAALVSLILFFLAGY